MMKTIKKLTTCLLALVALDAISARLALAQEKAAKAASVAAEPEVSAVVAEALRYFRVNPEVLESIRGSARARAALPLVAAGFRYDDDKFKRVEEQTITDPRQNDEDTNRKTNSLSVGAVWDLRELVFNPAEVQVYGLVGIQRDIILEVTRTYYLRKQLLLLKRTKPPEDQVSAATLDLRVAEYTALLDVLTGGWFLQASAGPRSP
jgi:hypothetical protein